MEADTKIPFFIHQLIPGNVVVRCGDTDILIILLGNLKNFHHEMAVWIDFGTGSYKNSRNVRKYLTRMNRKFTYDFR